MNEINDLRMAEGLERMDTAETLEVIQRPEELSEMNEMEQGQSLEASDAELLEQQEMDAFSEVGKLGAGRMIYYPDERGDRYRETRREGILGEYRTFCDTRPAGSRYNIFADGKGK